MDPRGAIALVEPHGGSGDGPVPSKQFLDTVEPRTALIKIHHARRLLDRGETADSWFPDRTTVITSTSIKDERLNPILTEGNEYRRGEWGIIREFQPDIHLPADHPDYTDWSEADRRRSIAAWMRDTLTIADHIAESGLDTRVIPLIKGVTPEERSWCYQVINQLGLDHAAYYANGYFSDGVYIERLLKHLRVVAEETRDAVDAADGAVNLLTISCLSPNVLSRAPDAVVAGTGQMCGVSRSWREDIDPETQSDVELRERYASIERRVAEELGVLDEVDMSRYEPGAEVLDEQPSPTETATDGQ